MRCPNGDNILIEKSVLEDTGVGVHYLACPTCGGHWLSSFNANYLRSIYITDDPPFKGETLKGSTVQGSLFCPQCLQKLVRFHGESAPDDVTLFHCPHGHGYFFPAGELVRFKKAQEAKVTYHKLWHVPITSVASTLLAVFVGLIISVGLVVSTIEGQRQQTITSQAAEVIASQKAYVDDAAQSVTIIAITSEDVNLTVLIDRQAYPMQTTDNRSHVVRITGIKPGSHQYFFAFIKNGQTIKSSPYSFSSF